VRIVIFVDWYYPAYKAGGPIKSIYNLVQALKTDYLFYIITSNCDLDATKLDVICNEWTLHETINVIYLTEERQRSKTYLNLIDEIGPSIIYCNSLFSVNYTLKPYLALKRRKIPKLIAPRGMLGRESLAIKSIKKKLFLKFANKFFFENKLTHWHATSKQERNDIVSNLGIDSNIKMSNNLASPIQERNDDSICKNKNELKLVFIARILPIKNLLFVLKVMENLISVENLSLDIYGPIEDDNYWDICSLNVQNDSRITYKGILKPEEISLTFQQYHFSILPTLNENYGHSIVESLVSGVPVIISDNTPWNNLVNFGVGIDLPLNDLEAWIQYLKLAISMNQKEYLKMINKCLMFSSEYIVNSIHKENAHGLFKV